MRYAIKIISQLKPGQSVSINSCDENLIAAWDMACLGLKHGIELVLDSNGIDLIVIREK